MTGEKEEFTGDNQSPKSRQPRKLKCMQAKSILKSWPWSNMAAIQEMCTRIGLVTGKGIAAVMKCKYSNKVLYPLASLFLIANTINIGADIVAISSPLLSCCFLIPFLWISLAFAVFMVISEILIPYNRYAKILCYLTVSLLNILLPPQLTMTKRYLGTEPIESFQM